MRRWAAALLLLACGTAQAHRFHMGIAEIAFNQNSGSVEVVHTYMAHDIEALLAALANRQVDLSSEVDEALLRQYIEQRFYLLAPDQARLPLKWVGMKAGVESVMIYQELEHTPLAGVAQVHDEVLADVLPRQSNTVNINDDGQLRSLAFDSKTTQRRLK